mmetsp:Transcript_86713/g.245884  ORF Transcript_86713/g.245884 Transcript_86713/m.245884 type:complete len:213 (+) Transcript_86713:111-749(+)
MDAGSGGIGGRASILERRLPDSLSSSSQPRTRVAACSHQAPAVCSSASKPAASARSSWMRCRRPPAAAPPASSGSGPSSRILTRPSSGSRSSTARQAARSWNFSTNGKASRESSPPSRRSGGSAASGRRCSSKTSSIAKMAALPSKRSTSHRRSTTSWGKWSVKRQRSGSKVRSIIGTPAARSAVDKWGNRSSMSVSTMDTSRLNAAKLSSL